MIVGSTPGRAAIKWLLLGQVTVYGQVNRLDMSPNTKVNSAFHPSGVGKLSSSLYGYSGARSPVSGSR